MAELAGSVVIPKSIGQTETTLPVFLRRHKVVTFLGSLQARFSFLLIGKYQADDLSGLQ
jgi:hypothetical protein